MLKIKFRLNASKLQVAEFNHDTYVGFKISKLPKHFAAVEVEKAVTSWFNYKGYTYVLQSDLLGLDLAFYNKRIY
jgi:hypothetical protein